MPLIQPKQYVGSGGGTAVPDNVVYVSPNFPDVYPFYSTLPLAMAYCPTTSIIWVYPGTYAMPYSALSNIMYCEPGVVLQTSFSGTTFDVTNSGALLGYAKLLFQHESCEIWIHAGQNFPNRLPRFECDSISYGGTQTRDTTGRIQLMGFISQPETIKIRDCNARVINQITDNPDGTTDRVNLKLECEYLYRFTQLYEENAGSYPHAYIDTKEFYCIEIDGGTCTVDFHVCNSPERAAMVTRDGQLTLRNGLIYCSGGENPPSENILVQAFIKDCKPLLRLEQVSMYTRKGCNVRMVGIGTWGAGYAVVVTKNSTFVNGTCSLLGDVAYYCSVYNVGGGSCANMATSNVTQLVSNILVDTNVMV